MQNEIQKASPARLNSLAGDVAVQGQHGQEDYVFGDSDTDARHWSEWVLQALQENQEALAPLFEE